MPHSERIQAIFKQSIALQTETAKVFAKSITDAAHNIANCFLGNNKLLICASGADIATAQSLEEKLINRYMHPRPGLPAILLSNNIAGISAIAEDSQYADIFSKQIRALGSSGDILLIITSKQETQSIFEAIDAAHEREMNVICINATEDKNLDITIEYYDIYIPIIHELPARIQETQLIVMHCLCDLIDQQLLGLEES